MRVSRATVQAQQWPFAWLSAITDGTIPDVIAAERNEAFLGQGLRDGRIPPYLDAAPPAAGRPW